MAPLTFIAASMLLATGVLTLIYWFVWIEHVRSADFTGGAAILRSGRYPLSGKPDALMRKGRIFTPVEYKSYNSGGSAREWDIAQLLSYCLLVEECKGRTNGGRLVYRDREFFIPWDERSRQYVESVMDAMLSGYDEMTSEIWKCKMCEFATFCGR